MIEDKYQIELKAQCIKLLLLKDEVQHLDEILLEVTSDSDSWLKKLRTTRSLFLTLNNVKDAVDKIQVEGDEEFIYKTRSLRKNLLFANHFRNRGIGHLNDTLLERAVQWSPQLFTESAKTNESTQIIEAQRTIIESCINSFVDRAGVQKVFGHEIDLIYPPDASQFFTYLGDLVKSSLEWLSYAITDHNNKINYHAEKDTIELGAVAAKTNFNLKEETDLNYSLDEVKASFARSIEKLKQHGVDASALEFVKDRFDL